jgi:Family of unknown function (DUF6184)
MKPTLSLLALSLALSGCGITIESARESAAQRSCSWFQSCKDIGPDKSYPSFEECLTKQRSSWLSAWPTASCDAGKLNPANLDVCLKAIDATTCGSFLDSLATLAKCDKSKVCSP